MTVISNTDVEGAAFLQHAHDRLAEYHMMNIPNGTYSLYQANRIFSTTAPPDFAVLATWNIAVFGAGGAWHGWTDPSNLLEAMFPLNSLRLHVVNEAFSTVQGWAEGSLRAADRVLKDYFNVPRPWSFNVTDTVQIVSQTSSDTCVLNPSSSNTTSTNTGNTGAGNTTGTNSTGGSSGGDTGGGEIDVCFTSSALVHMANGSVVPISSVNEGDLVDTGFGIGRVTKFLKHHVHDKIEVSIIPTEMGDLVGTPDHPIHVSGKWYEIKDAALNNLVNATTQVRYVDFVYNLEVDGDAISTSRTHSYMVNGIVASGLGDNPLLNQLYKRQKAWQRKQFLVEPTRVAQLMNGVDLTASTKI